MVTYTYDHDDLTATTKRNQASKARTSFGGKSPRSEFRYNHSSQEDVQENRKRSSSCNRTRQKGVRTNKKTKTTTKQKQSKNQKYGYPSQDTDGPPKHIQISTKNKSTKKNSKSSVTLLSNRTSSVSSFTNQNNDNSSSQELMYKKEIISLQETIKKLKRAKNGLTGKKKKDPIVSKHFEWYVKWIVKETIYPKVKFISSAGMLQDTSKETSIGNFFLKQYKELQHNNQYGDTQEMDDEEIWDNAKDLLTKTINQKRGTVQTALKKAWIGTYIKRRYKFEGIYLTFFYAFYKFLTRLVSKVKAR